MKCNGCEDEARTKKGWCSGSCYARNQRLVQNPGRKIFSTKQKICQNCNIIERTVEYILLSFGVKYKKQVPLLGKTVVDFLIGENLVIYADGDYWHSLPDAQRRDQRNNKLLEQHGYKCLRLLGSVINNNTSLAEQKIKDFLNEK